MLPSAQVDIHLPMSCNRAKDLRIGSIASVASWGGILGPNKKRSTSKTVKGVVHVRSWCFLFWCWWGNIGVEGEEQNNGKFETPGSRPKILCMK